MTKSADSELLRAVLASLGLSVRKAAELIGVPTRRFENWVRATPAPASCWRDLWRVRLELDAQQQAAAAAEQAQQQAVQARLDDLADCARRAKERLAQLDAVDAYRASSKGRGIHKGK